MWLQRFKGPLFLTTAMLLFSLMSLCIKAAGPGVPAIESLGIRGLVGLGLLVPFALVRRIPLGGQRRWPLFWRGLCGSIAVLLLFTAVVRIPVANAMLLNQMTPIFVLPLAALFLKERIRRLHVALVLVALGGAALVIRPTGALADLAGLLALGSAFFAAVAYVLVRDLTRTEQTVTIVCWFAALSTALALPWCGTFVALAPKELGLVLAGSVLSTAGQLLLTMAYRRGEAGRLAVLGSLSAVFGAAWDLLFFDHVPGLLTLLGGCLVITACTAIQILRAKAPAAKA